MESRSFIRVATDLISRIKDVNHESTSATEEGQAARQSLQREINSAFAGLQNPTLPSASKLRDAAQAAGFTVENRVVQRLHQADQYWL